MFEIEKNIDLAEFKAQFKFAKYYSSAEWRTKYADGTVSRWLQQVTDFFVQAGNISNPVAASQYFDAQLYMQTVRG
jgi:NitT/TauT family transport system substrate-binding protein